VVMITSPPWISISTTSLYLPRHPALSSLSCFLWKRRLLRPWSMVHPSCRKRKTPSLPCFPLVDLPLFSRRIMNGMEHDRGKRLREGERESTNSQNISLFSLGKFTKYLTQMLLSSTTSTSRSTNVLSGPVRQLYHK